MLTAVTGGAAYYETFEDKWDEDSGIFVSSNKYGLVDFNGNIIIDDSYNIFVSEPH